MSRILIMSDIHGNLSALNKIWKTEKIEEFEGIVLLGDLIDYGPHSNEVVEKLKNLPKHKILVNIWGNHEKAVVDGETFGRIVLHFLLWNQSRLDRCLLITLAE